MSDENVGQTVDSDDVEAAVEAAEPAAPADAAPPVEAPTEDDAESAEVPVIVPAAPEPPAAPPVAPAPVAPVAPPAPQYAPPPAPTAAGASDKSKIAAGLLAILLGSLGVHKFYLGYTKEGVIMLLASMLSFGVLAGVVGVIALIEGILYLTKSDEEFNAMYVAGKKAWF